MRVIKGGAKTNKKKFFFDNHINNTINNNNNSTQDSHRLKPYNTPKEKKLDELQKEKYNKELELLNENEDDDIGKFDVSSPVRRPKKGGGNMKSIFSLFSK